jgi:hypothetical protein
MSHLDFPWGHADLGRNQLISGRDMVTPLRYSALRRADRRNALTMCATDKAAARSIRELAILGAMWQFLAGGTVRIPT